MEVFHLSSWASDSCIFVICDIDCRGTVESFHKDLHATPWNSGDQMKGLLFLDVVVRKSATILELLYGEDQSLLVGLDLWFLLQPKEGAQDMGWHGFQEVEVAGSSRYACVGGPLGGPGRKAPSLSGLL